MATPLNYNNIKFRYKAAWGILLLYVGCPEGCFFLVETTGLEPVTSCV